ncbi:glycosyltransferase [Geobacter sulfurreducens]|uniref:glycosyltransferase family 2 protein n=1 Tax=Geobacter sulfurreducens TaxID=35554 RepID=UPI000696D2C8|nr:glycosyltransferase [Geobacter sulfurreducens]QVW34823.1 glycosyltransferase [Geobacter sulfurreducens]
MALTDRAANSAIPTVSVILPTYNQCGFLPKMVRSILCQTFEDFEFIIVNDGSTDGSREYLDQLSDPRVRVIHQPNGRLPKALNAGFQAARGRYFTWVSSDNWCAPVFLEALVDALDATPAAGFACSAFAWVDENDSISSFTKNQDLSPSSLLVSNPGIASFMYRSECHARVGWYDPELEGAEDWDMWLKITEIFETVYVPEILYYYRHHQDSMTAQIPQKIRTSCRKTFESALARRNHQLQLHELYPALAGHEDDMELSFYALFDFGSRLLTSPFDAADVASNFLQKAIELSPQSAAAVFNLGVAWARMGNLSQAASAFGSLTDTDKSFRALCLTLIEACNQKNYELLCRISAIQLSDEERRHITSRVSATHSATFALRA